jgi:hypothetical protein
LDPVGYVAYQTLIVRCRAGLGGVSLVSGVGWDWVGPLPAEAKLAPELSATLLRSSCDTLVLSVWPGEDPNLVAAEVERCGGRVLDVGPVVTFAGPTGLASELARVPAVAWVQRAGRFAPWNVDVQWVVQEGWMPLPPLPESGRPVWEHGLRGQGMLAGLVDAGLATEHDMFVDPLVPIAGPGIFPLHRKVAAYKLFRSAWFGDWVGYRYHGSAVCGTLVGNDSIAGNQSKLDGMAPDARVYLVDNASDAYEYGPDMTELFDSVRLHRGVTEPVFQVSGSFGNNISPGTYRLEESSLDAVCWRARDFFITWAAGNQGGGVNNIGHPACAKSCLTVGATGNGTESNVVADFSSRGPTTDERQKPEIVAPGDDIGTVDGAGTHGFRVRSGTSYSAPAASSALLLVRQYLAEGWFPSGSPEPSHAVARPSSALLRALAVAAADTNVGTEYVPNTSAGWGRLNLSRILYFAGDPARFTFLDDTVGLPGGWSRDFVFTVTDRTPLRVVLAWTDTAAAPAAAIAIVNDLNLELESPDGNRYHGNIVYQGQSRPNPTSWDELNTIEVCRIDLPLTGNWTARVHARNVITATQPFALAVLATVANLPAVSDSLPVLSAASHLPSAIMVSARLPLARRWSDLLAAGELALWNALGQRLSPADPSRLPAGIYYLRSSDSRRPPCRLVVIR